MNAPTPRPVLPTLLPDTAPFSAEQRSWLNGFFAGLVSLDAGAVTAVPAGDLAGLIPGLGGGQGSEGDADDGEAPWHDQTLPMAERMQMAEGRPLRRRFMAAMAQQDCGQCGYNCEDYADALAGRSEERLNLCVPGGKETARMLKTLNEELASAAARAKPSAEAFIAEKKADAAAPGRSRETPVEAQFLSRRLLNKRGSAKETWHVEFDLHGTGLSYEVGDSFGIFPTNDPALVAAIGDALGASPDYDLGGRSLMEALTHDVSLSPAPDSLFQLFSYLTGGAQRQKAKALAAGEDPDGDAATLDVLSALEKFPAARPSPEAFLEAMEPLQPRLYSISSSPKHATDRLTLTVDTVRYRIETRTRLGVASTYCAERACLDNRVKVYVQKAHNFALPKSPDVPIVMVGPGTGIAPFRAFLQERQATGAKGRNWLFFGHQRRDHDFFYEDELARMKRDGVLTRLTLAWSRDGAEKIYVQDRMREVGRPLWAWLAEGAHFYVCGDAKRMAKDVERALVDVVAAHGARSTDEAVAFVAGLKKAGRYRADVY